MKFKKNREEEERGADIRIVVALEKIYEKAEFAFGAFIKKEHCFLMEMQSVIVLKLRLWSSNMAFRYRESQGKH